MGHSNYLSTDPAPAPTPSPTTNGLDRADKIFLIVCVLVVAAYPIIMILHALMTG